ncbi:MAG: MBL fold metallo-hydrolase [Anaerolineales bacterium]|nr:MBL fold metallo-hydrolase [Anaerolineales bacterium]
MLAPFSFRWLGVAGLELELGRRRLLFDPFLTRPSPRQVLFGRLHSDRELVARHVHAADAILITHPHYDHLLDAPAAASLTGAPVYGSPNAIALLKLLGVPAEQLHTIQVGDRLQMGEVSVEVLPGHHLRMPIDRWINGRLRLGLKPPLRALDFKMDFSFSFLVYYAGRRLLRGDDPVPADALFTVPSSAIQEGYSLLRQARPRLLVPLHWDNFTRPAETLPRAMLFPGDHGWLRLRRVNPEVFSREVESALPETRVLVPQPFQRVDLTPYLGAP